jgi:hypothetical protein
MKRKHHTWAAEFLAKMGLDLGSRSEDFKTLGPMVVFQQMIQEHGASQVPSRKVRYASVDARGQERTCSGQVFILLKFN